MVARLPEMRTCGKKSRRWSGNLVEPGRNCFHGRYVLAIQIGIKEISRSIPCENFGRLGTPLTPPQDLPSRARGSRDTVGQFGITAGEKAGLPVPYTLLKSPWRVYV